MILDHDRLDGPQLVALGGARLACERTLSRRVPLVVFTPEAKALLLSHRLGDVELSTASGDDAGDLVGVLATWLGSGDWRADARDLQRKFLAVPEQRSPDFDPDALRLFVSDDPEIQRPLLEAFIQNAEATLGDLHEGARAGDGTRTRFVAHRLKSTARAMGAAVFGGLLEAVEVGALDVDGRTTTSRLAVCASHAFAAFRSGALAYLAEGDDAIRQGHDG